MRGCVLTSFAWIAARTPTHQNEYYALRRRLWRKIQPAIAGMLCLRCAERRLGRRLVAADFSRAPINAENARVCLPLALRLARV